MEQSADPRAAGDDLTAKARIRNAALDLYAEIGEDRASMRQVAAAAGVTVGLVVHHFTTKEGLRGAVEQLVVDYFALAIAQVPMHGSPAQIATARNASVERMLETHPPVVNYLRRALLEPGGPRGQLLQRLTELTASEITTLRRAGPAATRRGETSQVIALMVRQLGQLFLQPMIDTIWDQLEGAAAPADDKPVLSVSVRNPGH